MLTASIFLIFTYLFASVPFGLVLGTLYGEDVDIRSSGSGNIGATNVARVHGWKLAAPALLLDIGKGLVAVSLARWVLPEAGVLWLGLVALTAFSGHCFSIYLAFRGGKGVATGAGAMLAITPAPTLIAMASWGLLLAISGRSSVASLGATGALLVAVWQLDSGVMPVAVAIGVGIVGAHVQNIGRLVRGEEARVVGKVRWGRVTEEDPRALLEVGPGGQAARPALWREEAPDPLAPSAELLESELGAGLESP